MNKEIKMNPGYDYSLATAVFAIGGVFGFIFNLFMPKAAIFCWVSGIVIFAAQGALCNLLPSYVATKYGRWDYTMGYQVIGTIFEIGAGIGVMMTGFFNNFGMMYIVDLALLILGLIMMAASSDKFIGKIQ